MFEELQVAELNSVEGGKVTKGSLIGSAVVGGLSGAKFGAAFGSAICPGAGTVAGALAFGVMGAGVAMVTDVITGSIFKW